MKDLITGATALLQRGLTLVLAASLVFLTLAGYAGSARALPQAVSLIALSESNPSQIQSGQSLGERTRERIQAIDRNSERPKTMGEFEQEARDGVPLDERIQNIIRDSGEALKQFGQEYSVGAQETVKTIQEKT